MGIRLGEGAQPHANRSEGLQQRPRRLIDVAIQWDSACPSLRADHFAFKSLTCTLIAPHSEPKEPRRTTSCMLFAR